MACNAQAAKGIPEKQAKVMRDMGAEQPPPEDPVAHQIQEIEVPVITNRRRDAHCHGRGWCMLGICCMQIGYLDGQRSAATGCQQPQKPSHPVSV